MFHVYFFLFLGFLTGAAYSLYKIKTYNHNLSLGERNSNHEDHEKVKPRHCKICELTIPEKDHHCVWIDACISNPNMNYFLAFLTFICCSLVQAGLIFLTSVCLPLNEVGPFFLIPDRWCQRWNTHFEGDLNITWTAGIHCLLLALAIFCLLVAKSLSYLHHIYRRRKKFYYSYPTSSYSNGILKRWNICDRIQSINALLFSLL